MSTFPEIENFKALGLKTRDTIQGYLKDDEGWHTSKKTKDILIEYKASTCPDFHNGHLYRGQAEYNCSKEILFQYVDPADGVSSKRKQWDVDINDLAVLHHVGIGTDLDLKILRSMTNSACMGLISPRDFVDVLLTSKEGECWSLSSVSIDFPECPPDPKFVRAWNHYCGLVCFPVPGKPESTRLVTFIQPDIKGKLPKSLVESALPGSMTGFFNNLRACLKKDGHLNK